MCPTLVPLKLYVLLHVLFKTYRALIYQGIEGAFSIPLGKVLSIEMDVLKQTVARISGRVTTPG